MNNELLTREAKFEASSYNAEKRTVDLIFSTGAEVARSDWEGEYLERLDMAPDAVDLSALIGGPLLDNHDRFSGVRAILGVVESATVDGSRGAANVRFSDREEIQGVVRDVANGIIRNVSAGYTVQEYRVSKRADGVRIKTAVKWSPREVSLTAVAADRGAKVRSEDHMNEHDRIRALAESLNIAASFAEDLVTRNVPLEEARRALITEASHHMPAIDSRRPETITRDGGDGMVARMADALYLRIDPRHKPAEDARPFVGRRLSDLARQLLGERGVSTLGSDAEVITRSLTTTSDLANIVAVLANKTAGVAYQAAPSGVRMVCRQGPSHPDFRGRNIIRRGELPMLEVVNEHGEFKHGSILDDKQSFRVYTYGKIFGMTRQLLVNDDLALLADVAAGWGMAAREFENQKLVDKLTENSGLGPTLGDNKSLFHSDHSNVSASGAAIITSSLGEARWSLRCQKGVDGTTPINATPRFLLVPASLETDAEVYLTKIYPAEAANVNPFGGTNKLELVVDPRLDVVDDSRWYVFADPAILPCVEFAYLAGAEGVQIETRNGFDVDGVEIRARLDFGAGGVDFRGGFTNEGE